MLFKGAMSCYLLFVKNMNSKSNGPVLSLIFGIEIVSFCLSLRMTWIGAFKTMGNLFKF